MALEGGCAPRVPGGEGKGTACRGRPAAATREGGVAEARPTPPTAVWGGPALPPPTPPCDQPVAGPRALLWARVDGTLAAAGPARSSQWQRGGGGDEFSTGLTGARPSRVPPALGPSREVLAGGGLIAADSIARVCRLGWHDCSGRFSVTAVAEHHPGSAVSCAPHVAPPRLLPHQPPRLLPHLGMGKHHRNRGKSRLRFR